MPNIEFIHAADLHLDAPFLSIAHYPESLKKSLVSSPLECFLNLVELAISRKIAFLLLSGDIFDRSKVSLRIQSAMMEGLKRLNSNKIPVFIVYGNHDHIFFDDNYEIFKTLDQVHFFSRELISYRFNLEDLEIQIFGLNFTESLEEKVEFYNKLKNSEQGPLKICLLHDEIQGTSINELKLLPVNYWALGHLHNFDILHENPHIVYSGTIQGRSFKPSECGPKGVAIVDLDNNGVGSVEFAKISKFSYETVNIEVTWTSNQEYENSTILSTAINETITKDNFKIYRVIVNVRLAEGVKTPNNLDLLQFQDQIYKNLPMGAHVVDFEWSFMALQDNLMQNQILSAVREVLEEGIVVGDKSLLSEITRPKNKYKDLKDISSSELAAAVVDEIKRVTLR